MLQHLKVHTILSLRDLTWKGASVSCQCLHVRREQRHKQHKLEDLADPAISSGLPLKSLTLQQDTDLAKPKYEVTIYADEELRERVAFDIPLQVKHMTTRPLISSSLASRPCKNLGVDGLLKELNKVLRTSYSMDVPGLRQHLEQCIERNYDFGTAFARLRNHWSEDFTTLQTKLDTLQREDAAVRGSTLDSERDMIMKPSMSPRHVWDLYSNRVVPTWIAGDSARPDRLWAISHAQEDNTKPDKEDARKEEWKMDIPTVGSIYRCARIMTYLNGLGRPFEIEDPASEKHWLNRAWTLQEANVQTVIGGLTPHSPFQSITKGPCPGSASHVQRFYDNILTMLHVKMKQRSNVFDVLEAMLSRKASYEVDRIAGLAHFLCSEYLPAYIRDGISASSWVTIGRFGADVEQTWDRLVRAMDKQYRLQLACKYPVPGDGKTSWRPSWNQLYKKETPLPLTPSGKALLQDPSDLFDLYNAVDEDGRYQTKLLVLDYCTIEGLHECDARGYCRRRKLILTLGGRLRARSGRKTRTGGSFFWMVGMRTRSRAVQKVSVLEMEDEDERDRLRNLGLASELQVMLE
ncbi:hypothetical protein NM688_g1513 [Phlebia brevispora]|uniref:Uncharacterized protein n=1 Tax=Phlebia brevispora TaxID=194682 RepID=A0ACC1TAY9_9APHY|nr:hypothetical protein NM688_g1513 [Phlebia brevispora]